MHQEGGNGSTGGGSNSNSSIKNINHTVTALSRWSVAGTPLPDVDKVENIHVYDFDNTLFNSPLPNPKLWAGPTIGLLQTTDSFQGGPGGWWHEPRILAATGEGLEKEEARGWKGWWNEQIVELIKLSMEQKGVCTVLLTGRSEKNYTDLLRKMTKSIGLEFDMMVLKPKAGPNNLQFSSTMAFKQVFLTTLMETYKTAEEIRVYEDRIKHTKGFRDFFSDYNKKQHGIQKTRGPIKAEVIQVADGATLMDPVIETAEVQRLINTHNAAVAAGRARPNTKRLMIKRTVSYTGYLIASADTTKLLSLANTPHNLADSELKFLANNIIITPRPAPNSILEKVGGLGNKLLWEVTGTASFENRIWAAQVRPVPPSAPYYTENAQPIVVLALRKGVKPIEAGKIQNWQPVGPDQAFRFETTVGEKCIMRVEDEDSSEGEYESLFVNKTFKRKHDQDDYARGNQQRGGYQGGRGHARGGRGGGNSNRGRGGNRGGSHNFGAGRGRSRGGGQGSGHGYRSLDDVTPSGHHAQQSYNPPVMTYEDYPVLSSQSQSQSQPQQSQPHYQPQQQQGYAPPPAHHQQQAYRHQQQGYMPHVAPPQQFQKYGQQQGIYQEYGSGPQYGENVSPQQHQQWQGQGGPPMPY